VHQGVPDLPDHSCFAVVYKYVVEDEESSTDAKEALLASSWRYVIGVD
jgi:hypothetical protein